MAWIPPKIWKDGECWILGGGPSLPRQFGVPEELVREVRQGRKPVTAYSPYLSPIYNKHIIAVNNAYMLGDWVDVCWFGDNSWYLVHRLGLIRFKGIKATCNIRFEKPEPRREARLKYLARDSKRFGITTKEGHVSWNGNSGASAINLAYHFGAKRILLLGFDMQKDGNATHWHGGHDPHVEPPFKRHKTSFAYIKADAERLGIEILNVNPDSAIDEFPKVRLEDVL